MTITVTPTVEVTNSPPRVRLNVSAGAGEKSATVMRINPDGTQVPVRTADGNPLPISASSGLLYDYEMPFGLNVQYTSLESSSAVSGAVAVSAARPWLVHPTVPALSVQINRFRPGSFTKRTRGIRQSMLYPLGRANPLIVNDGQRHGISSSFVILAASALEAQAVETLTNDGSPLLLNVPATASWNISTRYIAVMDIDYSPVLDKVFEAFFDITLPFVEVDRPAGGSQAQRTLADLTVYATLGAVNSAYATLAAVTTGP